MFSSAVTEAHEKTRAARRLNSFGRCGAERFISLHPSREQLNTAGDSFQKPSTSMAATHSAACFPQACWVILFFSMVLTGCREQEKPINAPLGVREVRVLLADSADGCRLRVDGRYVIRHLNGSLVEEGDSLPWTELTSQTQEPSVSRWNLHENGGLLVESSEYGGLNLIIRRNGDYLPGLRYPGSLTIEPREDGTLRIINNVDVESYVAGVVPNESFPSFHDESLKGQAIAARTYVLYIMAQRGGRSFDLNASEGAQVYRGIIASEFARRARRAVEDTRGLVLAHSTTEGLRAFCTYYSSACGGCSQSIQFVQPGKEIEPLRGGVVCDYCAIGGDGCYRWGPSEIRKEELLANLKTRYAEMESWQALASVDVSARTPQGRIAKVVITGNGDHERNEIIGERFRLAVGSRTMRSTDCQIVDAGDCVRFENGKGFGHGVGMCQWGMEGQARRGKLAGEILLFYYPGAKLVRAY